MIKKIKCEDSLMQNYNEMSVAELIEEKKELIGTISNEKIWMFGSSDMEQAMCHQQNLVSLIERKKIVTDLIKHKS